MGELYLDLVLTVRAILIVNPDIATKTPPVMQNYHQESGVKKIQHVYQTCVFLQLGQAQNQVDVLKKFMHPAC